MVAALSRHAQLAPLMLDMLIVPPGCFNRIEDANTRQYDPTGPLQVGDIAARLKAFGIDALEARGLTDKANNFDAALAQRMCKTIVAHVKKLTHNFTRSHQRIVMVVDRRWRIQSRKFDAFRKLREFGGDVVDDGAGAEGSRGGRRDKPRSLESELAKHAFYKRRADAVYVYQVELKVKGKQKASSSQSSFSTQYCHETLIFLTKQCLIPRKNHHMHIGGDLSEGWLFCLSAHVERPRMLAEQAEWYGCRQRWYLFLQSAALRFFARDLTRLWPKYFIDVDEDGEQLTAEQVQQQFAVQLEEQDPSYKRWYYAIKRSD